MNALVKKQYLLQRFPGKGGWTYAEIPEIPPDKNAPFGWVRVSGCIDDYRLHQYHLMPMGNGRLFLPVKAAVLKSIRKQAGDYVWVELYADDSVLTVPADIKECLLNEPDAHRFFHSLDSSQQKAYLDWIAAAQKEATRIERICRMIDMLHQKRLFRTNIQQ